MRICISSKGKTLDDQVDERFGRCTYLAFVDSETMAVQAVKNPGRIADHGAGIAAAHCVLDNRADALITGHLGPNAEGLLSGGELEVYQVRSGTVQSAVDTLAARKLKQILPGCSEQ